MKDLFTRIAEPIATERLRGLLAGARERLTESQRRAMEAHEEQLPLDRATRTGLQIGPIEPARLRALAADLAKRRKLPAPQADHVFDRVPGVLAHAAAHPVAVSAVLWSWLAPRHGGDFAVLLVQRVRELASLPGLQRRLEASDPALQRANDMPGLVTALLDRQLDDACAWMEHVPPPLPAPTVAGDPASLSRQRAAIEDMRARAPHETVADFAAFARLAATFLVQLSARGLDPLGFSLGRDIQLDADPPVDRRLEIAAWALQAGRSLSPRGQMLVVAIPVAAPWPLRLELVAGELGRGACGGLGMVLRLVGEAPVVMTERAPMLLCFPGELPEERGPRFERWLSEAYPAAMRAWQAWS
ncbi:MAG TPA: hypothetical protein VLM79_10590 [Kofleriaceae bacterium]|nr:hypothetical protein [Kofleriaceae bacterium]